MPSSASAIAPYEELGFIQRGTSGGTQVYGECPLCGKPKFYINIETGLWSCKAGACGRDGNLITFLEAWLEGLESPNLIGWETLSRDRGLPVSALQEEGISWDGSRWVVPVRNKNGRVATLQFYSPGGRLKALTGIETGLLGEDELFDPKRKKEPVWLVEGLWDRIALKCLLTKAGETAIVAAVPGAGTFKATWGEGLAGRALTVGYDADIAGKKGTVRVYGRVERDCASFAWIDWPDATPDNFDLRDFYKAEGTLEELRELINEDPPVDPTQGPAKPENAAERFPLLSEGRRGTFEEVLGVYRENLEMTQDATDALRLIFAVILVQQLGTDPVWLHICSPPGGTKTELLMSCAEVGNVVTRSTVTVHSLVSGFQLKGKSDPSLLPQLNGRTFILKDFTEILDLPAAQRQEIYAILRGAYDGKVQKTFGTGIFRDYSTRFNMLSGTTPAVFRDSNSSVGERFLIYHMNKGVGVDYSSIVRAAIRSVGKLSIMRASLQEAAQSFLEYRIDPETDLLGYEIPPEIEDQLVSLAQLLEMLRATADRDFKGERILYKPQHALGTRVGKQLAALLIGLALTRYPVRFDPDDMRLIRRVAFDSCIGWNLEVVRLLTELHGKTFLEIVEGSGVPESTLRDRLNDMCMLGLLEKEYLSRFQGRGVGRPPVRYLLTEIAFELWQRSGIRVEEIDVAKGIPKAPKIPKSVSKKTEKASVDSLTKLKSEFPGVDGDIESGDKTIEYKSNGRMNGKNGFFRSNLGGITSESGKKVRFIAPRRNR